MGDASNYHCALGYGLSALGHEVTVASDGSKWMDTGRSIDLSRRKGAVGGAILWARLSTVLAKRLKGYDVVQISGPIFVEQRPNRVAALYNRLKRDNGAVFLTALATDTAFVRMCLSDNNPLRYSEWRVKGQPTDYALSNRGALLSRWAEPLLADHSRHIYDTVDGVVTALYEYHLAMERVIEPERLAYGGIPVDTDAIPFVAPDPAARVRKVFAPYHPGRELEKGTHILYDAISRMSGIEIERVTGLPYPQFVKHLEQSDAVVDQLYSYTPATTALLAMAMGKTVVTGAEADFESFIGDTVPAINPDPEHPERLAAALAAALTPEAITVRAAEARQFVVRHNDTRVVANRFINFWNTRL